MGYAEPAKLEQRAQVQVGPCRLVGRVASLPCGVLRVGNADLKNAARCHVPGQRDGRVNTLLERQVLEDLVRGDDVVCDPFGYLFGRRIGERCGRVVVASVVQVVVSPERCL